MIESSGRVFIETQDDAWDILKRLLENKIDPDKTVIDFSKSDWINFHLNYKGSIFKQTLTPSVMSGIVEYQRLLYQVIALVTKGDPKVTRLTDVEKETFELVFKVNEGSTDLLARAQEVIDAISGKVFDNMTSAHKMICVLAIALMFFGHLGFQTYLENNLELSKISAQTGRDKQLTDIIQQLAPSRAEKAQLLDEASEAVPQVQDIRDKSEEAFEGIVKTAGGVDELSVQGVRVGAETIRTLTQTTRRQAKKVTLRGRFTVSNVDTKVKSGFLIRFDKVGEDLSITANIADALLAERYRKVIERATFSKRPINVVITARQVGNSYLDAKVLKASTPRK
ncbi:hypothetical protein [Sinorhizobium meliloti]|uniref:hypothetical protein n=1 Tax=Rhizobium meliloti TaxID=382 RepID=UPI000FD2968A|nr:hypothetical protein [Sinorhizobium meliloti]RVG58494.1 hypothetical protein CN224_15985 [Sinorhizobium meliloti]